MELDCKQALAKILVADVLSSQAEADFRVFRDHLEGQLFLQNRCRSPGSC